MYDEYIILQKEIDVLEAKKKALREKIEKELPEEGVKTDTIQAIWKTVRKWEYTDNVKKAEEAFKAKMKQDKKVVDRLKEDEEESGVAKLEEVKQLAITVK